MSFPGKKATSAQSFGEVKGNAPENIVTKPPAKGKSNCTIAQYANILGGEKKGEKGK